MHYYAADIFQRLKTGSYGPAGLLVPGLHCNFSGVVPTARTYSLEPGIVTTNLMAGHSVPARVYESRNMRVNSMWNSPLYLVSRISGGLDNRPGLSLVNGLSPTKKPVRFEFINCHQP